MTGNRTTLAPSIQSFLKEHLKLQLGGTEEFTVERKHHLDVFGFHKLPKDGVHSIHDVEFTAICGPHGTVPIRVFYPKTGEQMRERGEAGALIYFHGGGYTVGSVDEFENGLRFLAEESGMQVSLLTFPRLKTCSS
jgi:acetyl esterase/lipase